MQTFLTIFILILLLWIYFLFFYNSKKKLTKKEITYYKTLSKEVSIKSISNKEKIITFDKIYHDILKKSGYKWTFWEILKKKPIIIQDLNSIWELHKLRNKLVHEVEFNEEKLLEKQVKNYFNEIEKLLKNW